MSAAKETTQSPSAALHEQALSVSVKSGAFIGGKFVPAASGETFDCISPIDGRSVAKIASCSEKDVDAAVAAARAAFDKGVWANMDPKARKKIMLRFADLLEKHSEELALLETLDMGKPVMFARRVDMPSVVDAVRWYGEAIDKIYDEIAPSPHKAVALVTREPIGVVAAVVPWNFPLLMASWKIAPALAAGNSVILKPAEQSPLTALKAAELAAEAGIPEGVFQVLPGFGETAGQALGRHMDVDMIAFTGSTEVGKFFLRYSGESNMKHISLECGGKTPNIVFGDATDLDVAAQAATMGVFFNSGQVCTAATRLLVQENIHDDFVAKVKAIGQNMQPGDPFDAKTFMGSIVDKTQMERIQSYIGIGRKEGADLVMGGEQTRKDTGGYYIAPTIFDRVDNKMRIAQEEIFGPVLSTISFKDETEALQIANDSIYGLQAAVWTNDINKAFRVARSLKSGTVNVNDINGGDIAVPFGGYKQSGIGRDKSLHAMEKYTQVKTTYIMTH